MSEANGLPVCDCGRDCIGALRYPIGGERPRFACCARCFVSDGKAHAQACDAFGNLRSGKAKS